MFPTYGANDLAKILEVQKQDGELESDDELWCIVGILMFRSGVKGIYEHSYPQASDNDKMKYILELNDLYLSYWAFIRIYSWVLRFLKLLWRVVHKNKCQQISFLYHVTVPLQIDFTWSCVLLGQIYPKFSNAMTSK